MAGNLTIASLSKLYDEINANAPPRPIAALLPIQNRFNDVANMIAEQIHIPVYRSAWIYWTRRHQAPGRVQYSTRLQARVALLAEMGPYDGSRAGECRVSVHGEHEETGRRSLAKSLRLTDSKDQT